ncbi:MAG: right-handed parallel beta-helix repeat-containing protein [Clostridia bacterium]|nr:right-handed parallel beta-helix repeat-containing protein [Clostridia bacterium]
MIYYVDNVNGSLHNDGISPNSAVCDCATLSLLGGDTVLFKRGTTYRVLALTPGTPDAPITYGAYGEGDAPAFSGGTDVSRPEDWIPTERENVWLCTAETRGCVGNIVLNGNLCISPLRYNIEDLSAQGDFFDSLNVENDFRKKWCKGTPAKNHLYLYSVGNPAAVYEKIEAIDFGSPHLCFIRDNVILDGLCFRNSSVHAVAGAGGKNVTVRNCHFENIGGCVWCYELKIRFGNAVEFWFTAENVLVENCSFKNVYDSCVTHQGPGEKTPPAVGFTVRNCRFEDYGMAAFEYRDKIPVGAEFVNNVCHGAGVGFATADGIFPRGSEIWPQPMGHHVFLWRIDSATDGGSILIANNTFGDAPHGAAIYSIISPEAEAQITLKSNRYTPNESLLIRFGGESFTDLEEYKAKTQNDIDSAYI